MAGPAPDQSYRAWGREIIRLVRVLADTNVEAKHFASILPPWLTHAIERERKRKYLERCGITGMQGLSAAA